MKSLLPFFFLLIQSSQSICPSGFDIILNRECASNYTRIYTNADVGITAGVEKCAEVQAYPIIIHSQEEQSYWRNRVAADEWTFIGLVCDSQSNKWMWADGSAIDFKPPTDLYIPDLDTDCFPGIAWVINSDGFWDYHGESHDYTTDIFCTKQLPPLPAPSADGCNSFEDDSDDGVCYQVGDVAENWQDAQMICQKLGANLASVHSEQANSFIRRLAVSRGAVSGVYLGATILGKGNDFAWIDGTDWDFSKFHSGFPIPGLGDCIAMDTSTPAGLWMNNNCSQKLPVACARDQRAVVEPSCSDGPWSENQIITSPGFPYDASLPCEYFLYVDAGKRVEIEIILLEANTGRDFLLLSDGFLGGDVFANLTGAYNNVTFSTSTTNEMRVSWNPNSGVDVMGVAFTYRAV